MCIYPRSILRHSALQGFPAGTVAGLTQTRIYLGSLKMVQFSLCKHLVQRSSLTHGGQEGGGRGGRLEGGRGKREERERGRKGGREGEEGGERKGGRGRRTA